MIPVAGEGPSGFPGEYAGGGGKSLLWSFEDSAALPILLDVVDSIAWCFWDNLEIA